MKKWLRILRWVLVSLAGLIVVCYILLQTSFVQTFITRKLADYLSKELGANVTVGRVDIDLWARLQIENLLVEDQLKDTLIHVSEIRVADYSYESESRDIKVHLLHLREPYFRLVRQTSDSLLNLKFLSNYIRSLSDTSDTTAGSLYADLLTIKNGRFVYDDPLIPADSSQQIDWPHMFVNDIDLTLESIRYVGDTARCFLQHLDCEEKSGFNLSQLSAFVQIDPGGVTMSNAVLATPRSDIRGDLQFVFDDIDDLDHFDTEVVMKHELQDSKLELADLAYFTEDLEGIQREIQLRGRFRGSVSRLRGKDVYISLDRHTRFKGAFSMDGLPDIDQTFINLDIAELTSNKEELERLPVPPFNEGQLLVTSPELAEMGQMTFTGNFTGFLNDFVAYGRLRTAIGTLNSDISLRHDSVLGDYVYKGSLGSTGFDLGRMYGTKDLGILSSNLSVEGSGFELDKMDATITGDIQNIEYNGYNYSNIKADGHLSRNFFEGKIDIRDPNVWMDFDGKLDFTGKLPSLNFLAEIQHLDLRSTKILPPGKYTSLSGSIELQSEAFDIKNFNGDVYCEDIVFCTDESDFQIGFVHLNSNTSGTPKITLDSEVADGTLTGNFDLEGLEYTMASIVSNIIPSYQPAIQKHESQNFNLDLVIHDFSEVSEIFIPELKLAPGTRIDVSVDESQSFYEGILTSDSVRYGSLIMHSITLDSRRPDEFLYITLTSDKFIASDALSFSNLAIDARSERDTVYTGIAWGDSTSRHSGDINGQLTVQSTQKFDFLINRSNLRVYNDLWTFRKGAHISLDSTSIALSDFEMRNRLQKIHLNGMISENPSTRLDVELVNLDISAANAFLAEDDVRFYGSMTGVATLRDVYHDLIFTNDLVLSDFKVNEHMVGDVCLESVWNNVLQQLNIGGEVQKGENTPLLFSGTYTPSNKKNSLNLLALLNDLDLGVISAFLPGDVLKLSGSANGNIRITGHPEAPALEGEVIPRNASVFVNYLNTAYRIEGPIGIYPDMIAFDHRSIYDVDGKKGDVVGQILHDNFGDWNFDLLIDVPSPMLAMNTTVELNPLYYGKAYASGSVGIFGFADQLEFDIRLKSGPGTVLSMPMGETTELTFENFIRFVDSDKIEETEEIDLTGIKMNFDLEITPDAEFQIIFDEAIGDVMRGRGKGNIAMNISNLSTFQMFGDVEVTEGNYLFTLKNLISKEFQVKPGGTISWYGDPFVADLNLETVYKVNASLTDIMPENTGSGQRVPVNLIMDLTGKLLNPVIDFKVELPSSDEFTRSRVASIVSTENEKNRQAFALLVMRRFVAPPGITRTQASSNAFAENTSEFISSQLSNWLSQLSDDFNLGVNYRPGGEISNNELELIMSTQFFNDKLLVMGNVGVSAATSNSQNPSNLIGDIRLEYKLSPEGKLRLVVYSESNDYRVTSTQQSPYVQGVGIIYQEQFDNWGEMMCRLGNLLRPEANRLPCDASEEIQAGNNNSSGN